MILEETREEFVAPLSGLRNLVKSVQDTTQTIREPTPNGVEHIRETPVQALCEDVRADGVCGLAEK
jgi:hypothetical protein